MNAELVLPFTITELRMVVESMSKTSCPGEDGFSVVFFQVHWDVIGGRLQGVCDEILESGVIP